MSGYTFTWAAGRQLSTFAYGPVTGNFKYNDQGIRTYKTLTDPGGTTTTTYELNGDKVSYEKRTSGTPIFY